jgi:uncharacterized protein (DUF1697 family)
MTRFVVFLRGINVGGRTIVKTQLQEAFSTLGYRNVSTFKQSGNVIFDADQTPQEIAPQTENRLQQLLGYPVTALVRTVPQLKAILEQAPFKGQNAEGASFWVTFLEKAPAPFPLQLPATIPNTAAQIISAHGSEVFSVTHGGGEGGKPNPFLEARLKLKATTRSINVVKQIVQKYS